jgi:hypothetical protein
MTMRALSSHLLCIAVCTFCASTGQAGELRPYTPPVQQSRPYEQKPLLQQPAQDPYYQDFAAKTARLDAKQREYLTRVFSQRLNEASKAKRWDEARHYAKLLDILNTRSAP